MPDHTKGHLTQDYFNSDRGLTSRVISQVLPWPTSTPKISPEQIETPQVSMSCFHTVEKGSGAARRGAAHLLLQGKTSKGSKCHQPLVVPLMLEH